jgi:23S rRNA (guanosine2251-2'-O)-methyltransferase
MSRRDPRRGSTEVVVFGRHPVLEALRSDRVEVESVHVAQGAAPELRRVVQSEAERAGVPCERTSREVLSRLTQASRHDQGVAARVRLLNVTEVEAWLSEATGRGARRPLRALALDGVTNSQNVGMVVRSVVGAGLDGLLWPVVGQPWVNGLVVRAAAGALFECPIVRCGTLVEGLAALQASGFEVFGLDGAAEESLFDVPPPHRSAFVLGSESDGISEMVRGLLDRRVAIPMAGRLESLNVAVAAGLVCFHAAGLIRGRGGDTPVVGRSAPP